MGQLRASVSRLSIGLLLSALGALAACGEGNLLEPMDPALALLEYETRMIQVRYTDSDGLPIQAALCKFSTAGETVGALLQTRVATTDSQGVCRVNLRAQSATQFIVIVDSDGAADSARVSVAVSNDAGGRIEGLVAINAAATVLQAEIRLLEDFDCALLDPLQPPPATANAATSRLPLDIAPGAGTSFNLLGLKANQPYTVVAIGRADDQNVSEACVQNIVLTEEQILMRRAYPLTLNLEDIHPDVSGNTLSVTSQFEGELGLRGVAALLYRMSDGTHDPADYVLSKMQEENDGFVTKMITAYRPTILNALSMGGTMAQGNERLKKAAKTLESVKKIELHTLMAISDEDDNADGINRGRLTIRHSFSHFTAHIGERTEKLEIPRGRQIFGSTLTPRLEDTASLIVENAQDVRITAHHMTVPIADAIVGKVLMDSFGDYRLDKIIPAMIDCSRVGELVSGVFPIDGLVGIGVDVAKRIFANNMCIDVVKDMVKDVMTQIRADLRNYRWDQEITFEGSASMKLLPDGTKIGRLVNGQWQSVGTFTARRQ